MAEGFDWLPCVANRALFDRVIMILDEVLRGGFMN